MQLLPTVKTATYLITMYKVKQQCNTSQSETYQHWLINLYKNTPQWVSEQSLTSHLTHNSSF